MTLFLKIIHRPCCLSHVSLCAVIWYSSVEVDSFLMKLLTTRSVNYVSNRVVIS